jgi:hypothetical protein
MLNLLALLQRERARPVLTAASAQISRFYDLPGGVGAGMADSKVPDNRAGYEKGHHHGTRGPRRRQHDL